MSVEVIPAQYYSATGTLGCRPFSFSLSFVILSTISIFSMVTAADFIHCFQFLLHLSVCIYVLAYNMVHSF